METYKNQAETLLLDAQKKLNRGFIASLFGLQPKHEEAVECYQRAASFFKMAQCWPQAAQAFEEAGKIELSRDSRHDAASHFIDAANCYKKCEEENAVRCFLKAINIYVEMGKFNMAAKCHCLIADIYENKTSATEKSIEHLEKAADYYNAEDNISLANKCLLKIAQYSAQEKHYEKALKIYENIAFTSLNSSLLKYSAKEYMFRASLCHLTMDIVNALNAIESYAQLHPVFRDSREYKFIIKMIECIEDQNLDDFTNCVREYDKICPLDPWYTSILLEIKQQISDKPDLR